MTGLEKMIAEIRSEADEQAREILVRAQEEAENIRSEATEQTLALVRMQQEKNAREREDYLARAASSAELSKKRAALSARQEIIRNILDEAYQTLLTADAVSKQAFYLELFKKNVRPEKGVLYVSADDQDILTPAYSRQLQEEAEKAGGSIALAKEPGPAGGGFVLSYGGVEENCSLKALFHTRREELTDAVYAAVFNK